MKMAHIPNEVILKGYNFRIVFWSYSRLSPEKFKELALIFLYMTKVKRNKKYDVILTF